MRGWGRACVAGGLCAWLAAAAQTTALAPPPGIVPTPTELAPREAPAPVDPAELPRRPAVPRELGKPDDDLALDVVRYELPPDAPAALREHLAQITRAYVGPHRSYEELVDAAGEVTRYLQGELGYYLGYAYLPEQSPKDGVVRIAILEGRLDRVELRWTDGLPVSRAVVEGYLAQLRPDAILRVRDVERIVFLLNDLRGITARFEVQAGSRPGTATLVVTPVADHRVGGHVDIDNAGSRFLGEYRASGLATVDSPFGRGDGLTGNVMVSDTRGLEFALVGYTTPVGSDGLKVGASVSGLRYQLDKGEFPQDLRGDSTAGTAYALYPNVRSRNLNLFTLLSLEQKNYRDVQAALATAKDVTSVSLGVSGDARDALLTGGVDTYDVSYAVGQVHYRDGRPGGLLDAPRYGKADVTFSRLQNLVTSRLLLYGLVKGQLAMRNLDTTEQFRLGGDDGVRAFAPGEGTGDSGAFATLELRLLPSAALFGPRAREFVFGLFYDVGRFERRHDTSGESSDFVNTGTLAGAGLSTTWEGAEGYAVRGSVALPTQGKPTNDTQRRGARLYLTLTKSFH